MREIKFRAWHKIGKEMVSDITHLDDDDYIYMQFTGLKDKNDKEIFEGDIVQNVGMPEYQKVGVVEFEGGKFVVIPIKTNKDKKYKGDLYYWDEVIGNIYENPELLEEKLT